MSSSTCLPQAQFFRLLSRVPGQGPTPNLGPAAISGPRRHENEVARWQHLNSEIYSQNYHFGLVYDIIYTFLTPTPANSEANIYEWVCPSIRHTFWVLRISGQTTQGINIKLGWYIHYSTSQIWLTFGYALMSFCCVLVSDWWSSFRAFANKILITFGSKCYEPTFIMGLPGPDQLLVLLHWVCSISRPLIGRTVSVDLQTTCWRYWAQCGWVSLASCLV